MACSEPEPDSYFLAMSALHRGELPRLLATHSHLAEGAETLLRDLQLPSCIPIDTFPQTPKIPSMKSGFPFLVALVISAFPIEAETHYVTVDGSGFSPPTLEIQAGNTVIWENIDETDYPHTTTSTLQPTDPNYWNGYLVSLGDTFSQTFNNPGTFYYTDQVDAGTGTIIVSQAVTSISLQSPRIEGGQFLFEGAGLTVGKTNVLLSSTNLTTWLPTTNLTTSSTTTFTNALQGQQFFRVVELP